MTRTREKERGGDGKKPDILPKNQLSDNQNGQSNNQYNQYTQYQISASISYFLKKNHCIDTKTRMSFILCCLEKRGKQQIIKKHLTPESLSYRCSRFPPNKMLLLGSTEPTGCFKICQMLASAFSQSRCGETNGSPFLFLFSSGYFST